ncbi:hypothetical protein, partial [Serpentinimonas barnesii]|uniref:hypothetical protein n=1 Tax=Serpentinimonas barnesii TaxID=1458427 RepID=UPI0005EEEC71
MYLKDYNESRIQGLMRLSKWMEPDMHVLSERRIEMLATGKGSRSGCLGNLFDDCNVRAMLAYFRDGNLH